MTPEEFTAKLQEFRAAITDKTTELEKEPKWATSEERVEIIHELEELLLQLEALIEVLEEEPEESDDGDEDN